MGLRIEQESRGRVHYIGRDNLDEDLIDIVASANLDSKLALLGVNYSVEGLYTRFKAQRKPIREHSVAGTIAKDIFAYFQRRILLLDEW